MDIKIEEKIIPILREYKRIISEMNLAIEEKNLEKADFLLEDANILQRAIFELLEENGEDS